MGTCPHLWFCAFKTATLGPKLHVSMGPIPHLWFSACTTAYLAPELLVSMGPSPHLWFLHAKRRDLHQNNKSLWVPDKTCRFVHSKSVIWTWITSLYGSQPSSVVFEFKTPHFGPELQVSMGPRLHQSFCACKTAWFAPEWQVYMGSRPHLWFWANIKACLAQE